MKESAVPACERERKRTTQVSSSSGSANAMNVDVHAAGSVEIHHYHEESHRIPPVRMSETSNPRAATSVAIKIRSSPRLKRFIASLRSYCIFSPWMQPIGEVVIFSNTCRRSSAPCLVLTKIRTFPFISKSAMHCRKNPIFCPSYNQQNIIKKPLA